jgi:hypothetical protein
MLGTWYTNNKCFIMLLINADSKIDIFFLIIKKPIIIIIDRFYRCNCNGQYQSKQINFN